MSIRITTGMIASGYNSNLNQSRTDLSKAQRQAYTYRAFDQVSDNPFAAGQTFQIRRATDMNEDYQSNLDNVQSAVTTAESTLRDVYSVMTNANTALKSVSADKNSSNNSEIATELLNMRNTILSDMNQEYADEYLFSGAGTSQPPFSTDADGNLLYRGINVDTGENTNGASAAVQYSYGGADKTMQINFGTGMKKQLEGYTLSIESGSAGSSFGTAVDTGAKTLKITVPAGKTKGDLQTYLDGTSFSNSLKSAFGITSSDMSGNTVSSTLTDPVSGSTSYSLSSNISSAFSAAGYSIHLDNTGTDADPAATVDTSAKTITIKYQDSVTTNQQLQDFLKSGSFEDTLNNSVKSFSFDSSGITIDNISEVKGDTVQASTGGGAISSYVNLSSLTNEKVYVDIGLGLNANAIDQTAYNAALPGINFLGCGTNSDGVSNNAYNLLTKMANILKSGDTGTALTSEMSPYMTAYSNTMDNFTVQQADVGSKMTFLTSTDNYLTDVNTNLQTKDENVEYVDPSDAIMNFYMQQYSYEAALQTGNSILQPTLLDFMK